MKSALNVFLLLGLLSCSYNEGLTPQYSPTTAIQGKWSVQKDSLNFGGFAQSYLKFSSDYYNFLANGTLLINEGGVIDTASYSSVSEKCIMINYKKIAIVAFIRVGSGVVANDTIKGRFGGQFVIGTFSGNSLKMNLSQMSKIIDPPIGGAPEVGPFQINYTVWLTR